MNATVSSSLGSSDSFHIVILRVESRVNRFFVVNFVFCKSTENGFAHNILREFPFSIKILCYVIIIFLDKVVLFFLS